MLLVNTHWLPAESHHDLGCSTPLPWEGSALMPCPASCRPGKCHHRGLEDRGRCRRAPAPSRHISLQPLCKPVHWFLDKMLCLPVTELNEIEAQPGGYHVLTLRQLALKDSGTVHFEAGDQRTSAALQVTGRWQAQCPVHGGDQSVWLNVQPQGSGLAISGWGGPGAPREGRQLGSPLGWSLNPRG